MLSELCPNYRKYMSIGVIGFFVHMCCIVSVFLSCHCNSMTSLLLGYFILTKKTICTKIISFTRASIFERVLFRILHATQG